MRKTFYNIIDSSIGNKLKILRLKRGKSLNEIGNILGVSFQQVQKYEKGTNKISVSNLCLLARSFDVTINYFFDNIHEQGAEDLLNESSDEFAYNTSSNVSDQELTVLIKHYSKIKDSSVRRGLLDLLKAL